MRLARVSLTAVVVPLSLAFLADLSAIIFGGMTADAYYLPLQKVPLGEHRKEFEGILIYKNGDIWWHQRRWWLIIHGSALECASLALVAISRPPTT